MNTKQEAAMRQALERIADPQNTHFAGDAQVVAREALAEQAAEPVDRRHLGSVRGYHRSDKAYYAATIGVRLLPNITIGQYFPEGGTTGEYDITWMLVGGKLTPRLQVFDDAWQVLQMHADLIAALAKLNNTYPTPSQIEAMLQGLGFRDMTKRVRPGSQEVGAA